MANPNREIRLNKPQDVRRMLQDICNELRHDHDMEREKRARVLGYLGDIILTTIRDGDLEERLVAVEKQLQGDV